MDESFRDSSTETRVKEQGAKETARGDASIYRSAPPWKIGDQLDDFTLEAFLGRGSSGFVYRAFDRVTRRHCALKLLLPGTPEELVRDKLGFRRMMSIQHPNLLRVDRIHQLSDYIALSMEEVDGETLPQALKRLRGGDVRVAYRQLVKLTRQYAAGLAVMHVNGYVHRDVKPHNLMVDRSGNGRVIDYGLVGTFDTETDPDGHRHYLAGTPRYFAPEMLWSQNYLPAGDIFGLGIVMLEALHSITWVADADRKAVERSEQSEQADADRIGEAFKGLDEAVPDDLREICLEMLQRDPGDRPTAMRVARLGEPPSATFFWPQESPLVGRQREVGEMIAWLDAIYAGGIGRLHLTGPSGIGKTRLVEDIEKYIRAMRWGQVFYAKCRAREDRPLQAFDQICDAIANRYKKGDREPLELDPVSTAILHKEFPALGHVVECSMQLAPADAKVERLDTLEATERMSHELRKVGPLILIVDDLQWADRDSLNVLDRLQSASGEIGLGIITVSCDTHDRQRVAANHYLPLEPLGKADSIEMLSGPARSWDVNVSDAALADLAEVAGGNPFRLRELADEFRPGGALSVIDDKDDPDDSVSQLGQVESLWRKRANRLSFDAHNVLAHVVTAGCRVSTKQLGDLTKLGDAVDAAVSELAQQRLVTDDATGGECIQIVHDRVADGLIKTLRDDVKRKAHLAWAALLMRASDTEEHAARIAGHFFAAGAPSRAVSFAVLAADQAERLGDYSEAARWHAIVIEHVDGLEKIARLRSAARCYGIADHPIEAAKHYQMLAEFVDPEERIECQILATTMSIRGGKFADVREPLRDLAKTLGLPRPKPDWLSKFVLLTRSAKFAMTRHGDRWDSVPVSNGEHLPASSRKKEPRTRSEQALDLCDSLARPLSIFDNLYAAELNMTGETLAARHGTPQQRLRAIIGRAVFGCYDRGAKRTESETTLLDMRPRVASMNDPRASADMWSGVAFSHGLSCRWSQVPDAVRLSVKHYRIAPGSSCFELAHIQWLELWASWHLGRWDELFELSDLMINDATRRNDLFQRLVVTNGLGCSAWLGRDRTRELETALENDEVIPSDKSMQMFHVFRWITSLNRLLYDGNYEPAWQVYLAQESKLKRLPYSGLQLIRVLRRSLGALTALHMFNRTNAITWVSQVTKLTRQLRREGLDYSRMLADFYDGLLQLRCSVSPADAYSKAARVYLDSAAIAAQDMHLRPFQLAIRDALLETEGKERQDLLRGRMERRGVVSPRFFERLYTVRVFRDRSDSSL